MFWIAAVGFGLGTVLAMVLYGNITTRKMEANSTVLRIAEITETTIDPAEWGKNFPRQYDGYIRTINNPKARFRWSDARPPEGEEEEADAGGDPYSKKTESKLVSDTRLRTIFNGHPFAIDYRERRGHAFMLHDQRETERVKQKSQPGACLSCHSSNVVAYREVGLKHGAPGSLSDALTSESGQKQLFAGWEHVNPMPYADATALVSHPVSCLDCHDPKTMVLRITRPAFIEGIANLAMSSDPLPHLPSIEQWRKGDRKAAYNPNDLASRQEMRSMLCAQCHVEYYFKGDQKRLTFPWHKGLKMDQMEAYYDEVGWSDWTHKDSGAKVVKAQHPEFELWSQGIHARSGVSCADCHMPYKREGAMKYTDHQIKTPMAQVNLSCQTCHNYTETEIKSRVDQIQSRTKAHLDRAEIAVVELIHAIKAAAAAGATDEDLKSPRALQRKAQWRSDFINAENSMGFHAPAESLRIIGESIDYARQGTTEVARLRAGTQNTTPPPVAAAPAPHEAATAKPQWVLPAVNAPRLQHRTFESAAAKATVSYFIYTPEQYDTDKQRRFPVLYWLHGSGGGGAGVPQLVRHFDAAIAAGKTPPMLVVFANGLPNGMWCDSKDGKTPVETMVVKELVPHIDATFRTIASREGRLIEGFSMGGYGAARLGFKHHDLFGAVSILGGGPLQAEFDPEALPRGNPREGRELMKTVYGADQEYFKAQSPWVLAEQNAAAVRATTQVRQAIGDRDVTLANNRAFDAHLTRLNIPHTFTVPPGVDHNPKALLEALGEANWEFYRAAFAAEAVPIPAPAAASKAPVRALTPPKEPLDPMLGGGGEVTTLDSAGALGTLAGTKAGAELAAQVDFANERVFFVSWGTGGPPFGTLRHAIKTEGNAAVVEFSVQEPPGDGPRGEAWRVGADFFAAPKGVTARFGPAK